MTPIVAFGISLTALMLFLAFKIFERKHSVKAYTSVRKKGDVLVVSLFKSMQERVRSLEKHLSVRNIFQVFMHHAAGTVARTARSVETGAQNVTRKMARSDDGSTQATKSKFLEEVSTHKRGLDTERVRRETSLTDEEQE